MQDFTFHRPKDLAEAVRALKEADEAKLLAGGQSLLPVMKLDLAAPPALVSIRHLDELRGIRTEGDRLVIGAATTHAEVSRARAVHATIPALAELAGEIGDPQVRNRGTLGGSVAHNDPAADYPAALVAFDAVIVTSQRRIAAEDFFQGMFQTALEPAEIIKEVSFAVPRAARYMKFANPASRYAIVGVMVARHADAVRVAVTGAGPGVFRVSEMEQALARRFAPEALDGIAVPEDELASDGFASATYRAHLIGVMARRAVAACAG
jgi:aerobic carbon-monoxide dehydrogenase medium subunit